MTIFLAILNLVTGLIGSLTKLRSYKRQIRHAKLERDSIALENIKTAMRARQKVILARRNTADTNDERNKSRQLRKTDTPRDKYQRD